SSDLAWTVCGRGAGQDLRLGGADPLHPAPASRAVSTGRPCGGGAIVRVTQRLWTSLRGDPGGAAFLALLAAAAIVVPALNWAVPGSSPLHLSTYALPLIGKYLCYAM